MALPDEATVLDYINSCAVPPSLRDITRAFKIGQDQRASMRRMLRDMAERGILAGDRRGIAAPDTLPEVAVLELTAFDDNGDGMARQAGNDDQNQPEIRVILSRRAGRARRVWPGPRRRPRRGRGSGIEIRATRGSLFRHPGHPVGSAPCADPPGSLVRLTGAPVWALAVRGPTRT